MVLSEIHYLPGAGSAEFVEIQNISRRTVSLFHPTFATNTWRIEGLEVTLPQNLLLAPGELLLVVAGDPQFFRSRHGIDPGIRILGGMQGTLQDDGERLRLVRPEISPSGAWFDITMDEVRYDDAAPWPQNLAAGGFSLQRRELHRFGSEPANWEAAAPTPGRSPNYDRDGDGLPDAWESLHQTDPATPDADADPDQDGLTNYQEFLAGTDPQDAASRLELQIDPAGPVLRFLAKAEVPYTLEFLEDFDAQWEVLISFPAASTDLIREVTDPAPEAHQRFYRLRVP